jgi:hypothetical protein
LLVISLLFAFGTKLKVEPAKAQVSLNLCEDDCGQAFKVGQAEIFSHKLEEESGDVKE